MRAFSRFIGDSADRRRWTRAIHRSSSAWRFPLLPALLFVHTFDKSKVLLLSHTCSKPQTCKSAHRHLFRLPSFLSRFPWLLNNPDHVLLFPERRLKVRLWFCFAPCRSGQWLSVARPQRQDVWERLQMDGRQADGKTVLLDRSVDATWKLHFYSAEAAKVHTFSTPVEVQILKKKDSGKSRRTDWTSLLKLKSKFVGTGFLPAVPKSTTKIPRMSNSHILVWLFPLVWRIWGEQ